MGILKRAIDSVFVLRISYSSFDVGVNRRLKESNLCTLVTEDEIERLYEYLNQAGAW